MKGVRSSIGTAAIGAVLASGLILLSRNESSGVSDTDAADIAAACQKAIKSDRPAQVADLMFDRDAAKSVKKIASAPDAVGRREVHYQLLTWARYAPHGGGLLQFNYSCEVDDLGDRWRTDIRRLN
jgi:hypothetical protein